MKLFHHESKTWLVKDELMMHQAVPSMATVGFLLANFLHYHVIVSTCISSPRKNSPATMEHDRTPVAIRFISSIEIIDCILKQDNVTISLIVCASRSAFLEDLQGELHGTHSTHLPESHKRSNYMSPHTLLSPTLRLLATSRMVRLAFIPTLPHLRAYLAALKAPTYPSRPSLQCHQPNSRRAMLVILSLVDLHRSTIEYSAQGISRTLAIAVETARLAGLKLVLGERYTEDNTDDVDRVNESATGAVNTAQRNPWTEEIPVLSGSVRFGNGKGLRAGRTINVGNVLGRWCRFVTMDTIFPRESDILLHSTPTT